MITTYLSERQHIEPTGEKALDVLLKELNDRSETEWRISKLDIYIPVWFFWTKKITRYCLYAHVGGPEFQMINFYRPDTDFASLSLYNDAAHVAAYLYGYLGGMQDSNRSEHYES